MQTVTPLRVLITPNTAQLSDPYEHKLTNALTAVPRLLE
jgi:hypothetical protein